MRVKSFNSILGDNAKQIEQSRSKLASLVLTSTMDKCQQFIDKVGELKFLKIQERQVNKLNRLLPKKQGNITWLNTQTGNPQAINPPQAVSTWAASTVLPQAGTISQGDSTSPQAVSTDSQGISTASPQAGSTDFQGNSTIPPQAGNGTDSQEDSAIPPQAGNGANSQEDSAIPHSQVVHWQFTLSQAAHRQFPHKQVVPGQKALMPRQPTLFPMQSALTPRVLVLLPLGYST